MGVDIEIIVCINTRYGEIILSIPVSDDRYYKGVFSESE
jgi:hypothetical protein